MIDDNPGDCDLVHEALLACHPHVHFHSVPNGAQAFEFLGRKGSFAKAPRPDVIILDLNLPVLNGHRILKLLQNDEAWKLIPVVIQSSSELPQDKEETRSGGARRFLVKPATWDEYPALLQVLEEFWGHERTPPVGSRLL